MSNRDSEPGFVAVDWGTSSFRAWLMAPDGTTLAETRGEEGMLYCAGTGFEPVLRAHVARLGGADSLPVLICGMAGARQGWVEAPYLQTPTHLHALHEGAIRLARAGDIRILPGVAQANPEHPDVMRGEETQLLGGTEPDFSGLVCIPGTHSKWVRIEAGRVIEFTTYMTGELFSVLSKHSILTHAVEGGGPHAGNSAPFLAGVAAARAEPAELTAALFRVRAGQLLGFAQRAEGAARLSGVLIGTEIAAALKGHCTGSAVRLIAADSLGALYAAALDDAGIRVTLVDAEAASRAGLWKAAMNLWGHDVLSSSR